MAMNQQHYLNQLGRPAQQQISQSQQQVQQPTNYMAYRNNRLMSGKSLNSQRSNQALPPRDPREAQYLSQKDLHDKIAMQARNPVQHQNRNLNYLHSKMQSQEPSKLQPRPLMGVVQQPPSRFEKQES
jgi:hypothetical protein